MDTNSQYWLNRVAVKLYDMLLSRADTSTGWRWRFDWDDTLTKDENLKNVATEDEALTTFETVGAIKSLRTENWYRNYHTTNPEDPLGKVLDWSNWEITDPAHREYDYLRVLNDIRYDKFVEFCKGENINYKGDKIVATLEIINQTPLIHVGDKTYTLKTLQDGTTLVVIEAAYDHPDRRFGFPELRQWTGKTFEEQKRFTDIFRKNEVAKGNVLSPFADITTKTFILKKQALLTPDQLSAIQTASTN